MSLFKLVCGSVGSGLLCIQVMKRSIGVDFCQWTHFDFSLHWILECLDIEKNLTSMCQLLLAMAYDLSSLHHLAQPHPHHGPVLVGGHQSVLEPRPDVTVEEDVPADSWQKADPEGTTHRLIGTEVLVDEREDVLVSVGRYEADTVHHPTEDDLSQISSPLY